MDAGDQSVGLNKETAADQQWLAILVKRRDADDPAFDLIDGFS
jgi:hypothetical protein